MKCWREDFEYNKGKSVIRRNTFAFMLNSYAKEFSNFNDFYGQCAKYSPAHFIDSDLVTDFMQVVALSIYAGYDLHETRKELLQLYKDYGFKHGKHDVEIEISNTISISDTVYEIRKKIRNPFELKEFRDIIIYYKSHTFKETCGKFKLPKTHKLQKLFSEAIPKCSHGGIRKNSGRK